MKSNIRFAFAGILAIVVAITIAVFVLGDTVQVVIDPGHGGNDVGAEFEGRYEKDDNLALALLVKEKLDDMGIDVILTRDDDSYISLEKRCRIANRKKALLFVSLHRNSADGAQGVEIWVSDSKPTADAMLANDILDGLESAGISENRGVKYGYAQGNGNYYVNSHTLMPSCLVELGFINSEADNRLFDSNLEIYAQAIAEALNKSIMKE
ncbi:MAG: N-acetylmuramoyl-L-alanine amidase [Acutalibacteraceae bacterium]|nr:N-acetylmuramoyl-L-alanine amidase [Acutalibacteraceae bacterium]